MVKIVSLNYKQFSNFYKSIQMLSALRTTFWLFLLIAFCSHASQAQSEDNAQKDNGLKYAHGLSSAFEQVANTITPSVVNIVATKKIKPSRRNLNQADPFFEQFRDFFGEDFMDRFGPYQNPDGNAQQGLGTGVVVDSKGHILTNNHVVGEADEVTVRLNNDKTYKAKVIGTDPRTDLAVIKIDADKLTPANLGNSDSLKIGEWVVAAGNPFGLDNSITAGIVSAKGRSIMGGGQYEDFIQTDAAINPGNSGGPLVNLEGEVIGINTAIFSRSGGYMGIGFAIPINMARTVMESLISKGKVVRGWLGVGIQNLTEDLAQSFNVTSTEGALVGHVEDGGPAAKAGLKQGDIIIAMDGTKIKDINQLRNDVAALRPGQDTKLDVLREGRKISVSIEIGELPGQKAETIEESDELSDLGMSVDELTPELARRLKTKHKSGVVVRRVDPTGAAAKGGIQPRDIIVSINGKDIDSAKSFNEAIEAASLKKGIRIVVETEGMERFVFLKSEE